MNFLDIQTGVHMNYVPQAFRRQFEIEVIGIYLKLAISDIGDFGGLPAMSEEMMIGISPKITLATILAVNLDDNLAYQKEIEELSVAPKDENTWAAGCIFEFQKSEEGLRYVAEGAKHIYEDALKVLHYHCLSYFRMRGTAGGKGVTEFVNLPFTTIR